MMKVLAFFRQTGVIVLSALFMLAGGIILPSDSQANKLQAAVSLFLVLFGSVIFFVFFVAHAVGMILDAKERRSKIDG